MTGVASSLSRSERDAKEEEADRSPEKCVWIETRCRSDLSQTSTC